jgi:hypothetical protein
MLERGASPLNVDSIFARAKRASTEPQLGVGIERLQGRAACVVGCEGRKDDAEMVVHMVADVVADHDKLR